MEIQGCFGRGLRFTAAAWVAFWVMGGWGGSSLVAGECSGKVLDEVQAAYRAIGSFSGQFLQEDRRANGRIDTAGGEIAYLRPGKMRWRYLQPSEQLLVTDGKTVWLFDPLLDNVTVQPLEKLTQGTPLAFLLGAGNLSRDFTCRDTTQKPPSDGLTYLELLPRHPIPGLEFIQLGVGKKGRRIEAMRMVDSQGNVRLLRLQKLRMGAKFPKGHFTFKIDKGMEVISK